MRMLLIDKFIHASFTTYLNISKPFDVGSIIIVVSECAWISLITSIKGLFTVYEPGLPGSSHERDKLFLCSYIEDITRRREDMTFIFEW
jgi:hypothetical protein